jgi:CRISPR-associated protein Cmr6
MAKGILKVNRTNKGKIFVELDKQNGKPPQPLSYVVFPNTDHNGKECEYKVDAKGIFEWIKIDDQPVWSRASVVADDRRPQQNDGATINNPGSKFRDSLIMANTFLPRDVRQRGLADIDNFALKLQKAARYEQGKDSYKFVFYKNDNRERVFLEIKANYGHLKDNFEALCNRQAQQAERLFPGKNRKITLSPQWRLILGIGGESVYETNMTLHHLYGMPYLPSSSIKGVLRSWVISQVFAQSDNVPNNEKKFPLINAEARAIRTNQLFCTIFGCPEKVKTVKFDNAGNPIKKNNEYQTTEEERSALNTESQGIVTFFDGLPTVAPVIKTDVMNVHYKDWYKELGYQAPTDTQRTNPIHFLTVSNDNNLAFTTHIAVQKDKLKLKDISNDYMLFIKDTDMTGDTSLLDLVAYWLKNALTHHGIGAKTAVGYGYFKGES